MVTDITPGLLPATVSRRQVGTARGTFAVLVASPPAPGATYPSRSVAGVSADPVTPHGTALLLPGFTGAKEDFLGILGPLAARGWQVIALDQRGQYETPGDDDPASYDLEALAADAEAVASAATPGSVHLLGHSFGGLVARAFALTRPDRLASLTLLDSGPGPVPPDKWPGLQRMRELLTRTDLDEVWVRRRRHELASGATVRPPEVEEFLRRRFLRHAPTCLARIAEHLMTAPDLTDSLALVVHDRRLPVLVAWGEADDAWPPTQQRHTAEQIGATWVEIPGAAHSPAAEAPDRAAELLDDFWSAAQGRVQPTV